MPDPVELRALLIAAHAELALAQVALQNQSLEIQNLRLLLAKLKRMQFGRSSEKLNNQISQLELQLEELETGQATKTKKIVVLEQDNSAKPVRQALPGHLPRETQVHAPACTCPECGGELKAVGVDVTEELEYVPARFKVIRHERPKFSCGACELMIQAPMPSRPHDTTNLTALKFPNHFARTTTAVLTVLDNNLTCNQGRGVAGTLDNKPSAAMGEIIDVLGMVGAQPVVIDHIDIRDITLF